jgi:hypothetical protein
MSYTATVPVTISLGGTQILLEELYIPVKFKSDSEYSYYLTCRDTKQICDDIEWELQHPRRNADIGIIVLLGILHRVLKSHWNEYIGAKMRACSLPGGKARKQYLYQASAEYRFEFSQ